MRENSCDALLMKNIVAFGKVRQAEALWKYAILALPWAVWQERNSCIFEEMSSVLQIIMDI